MAKDVRLRKPYSDHPGDAHLEVVLAKVEFGAHPWVTWMFNKEDGGYFWGHYFETQEEAVKDYNERGVS